MKEIFAYTSRAGKLCEYYDGKAYLLRYTTNEDMHTLSLYDIERQPPTIGEYYLGYTKEQINACGRDLLGQALLSGGDPDYKKVKAVLPPLTKNTYAILGGVSSVAGLTVDSDGVVYHQLSGDRDKTSFGTLSSPIFTPSAYDGVLGAIKPYQALVGGEYPLLISVHTDGSDTLEFLYFVEPTEPDRDPILWIRIKRYKNASPENTEIEYRVVAIAREEDARRLFEAPPSEEIFLDALADTVGYWVAYAAEGALFSLPEGELAKIARGTLATAAITCTAEHPHYGHRFYGKELHDNFPPNYIWLIETLMCHGRFEQAKDTFFHFIKYAVRHDGRINYRQGSALAFGASAAEYGQLLHLAWQYRDRLGIPSLSKRERQKLFGMGEEILSSLVPCPECDGLSLIRMCAEADTNERIHVYLSNNLWAVRGLSALGKLFKAEGQKYREAAELLSENITHAIECHAAKNTRFGTLPPFRIGYTATPMTLSRCEDTFRPLEGEERTRYFATRWERQDVGVFEDIAENSFANYRYYPEMLSSMLLSKELSDAIVAMRESLGGELLGMTRLLDRIDDWPVAHYARFLLETDRTEKYLLLLYAHAAHHGIPTLMSYYEQVTLDGEVRAYDCLPSLLTVPLLICRAFAYETAEGDELRLLSGLPKAWCRLPFFAKHLGYSGGLLDITSDGERIEVRFASPSTLPIILTLRGVEGIKMSDIEDGAAYIKKIQGNTILFGAGCQRMVCKV